MILHSDMVKRMIYFMLLILAFVACEEIYRPRLDKVDDFLVVEAALVSNQVQNNIYLYKTLSFNEGSTNYPVVTGALIYLVDQNNNQIQCQEINPGTYQLDYQMNSDDTYHLYIEYRGEKYVSGVQTIPEIPVMDSVYAEFTTKTVTSGVANSTDKISKVNGFQVYSDMNYTGELNHYRFYGRKIVQYITSYETDGFPSRIVTLYGWRSIYPTNILNIAGPPQYSTEKDIKKHPLEFFESDPNEYYIADTVMFGGWIYCIYQYGINEDTYNFYSDLNNQLNAVGKIFDPVYIQAKGNISCSSDPEKVVLGNFEISTFSEKRFYLNYYKLADSLRVLKPVPFLYDIPEKGEIKIIQPDFWESVWNKFYQDE